MLASSALRLATPPFCALYIERGTTLAISSVAGEMLLYSMKKLALPPASHARSAGNKKVVPESNQQSVIVWLIGSRKN